MERFILTETAPRVDLSRLVLDGLGRQPRSLPPRLFYDDRGTALFERICGLPEYYLTRLETELITRHAADIPPTPHLVEFGCGTSLKVAPLVDSFLGLRGRVTYMPVDISRAALVNSSERLLAPRPALRVHALQAEFEDAIDRLPETPSTILLLGSNIGNFERADAADFLGRLRGHSVLIGFDMVKEPAILHAAYNDAAGVTAEFNRNILNRINRELGGDFETSRFEHRALFNEARSRVEMHLVSMGDQVVAIQALGRRFDFGAGDGIHTENSYKFTPDDIRELAFQAGFKLKRLFTDPRAWFSLALLEGNA